MRTAERGRVPRILVVEDDVVVRRTYNRFASKLGYKAEDVASVGEAAAALRRERFDLIILDAHLSDAYGSAVIMAIREAVAGSMPPMVVISSDDSADLREAMLAAGADEFLAKPVSFARLSEVLAKWLSR